MTQAIHHSETRYPACLERPDLAGRVRTRTADTEAEYRERYAWLRKRTAKALDGTRIEDTDVADVARWLAGAVSSLSHATYRQYRAAVHQELRDLWDRGALLWGEVEAIAATMLVIRGDGESSPYAARRPHRTSAGRSKGVSENIASKLVERAAACDRQAGEDLADYFTFAPKLGLRNCEWAGAQLEGSTLIVPCGKFSVENARGIAPFRKQLLHWETDELDRLQRFLSRLHSQVNAADGRADLVMRRLGDLLRQIRRGAGAPRITLRTTRHQFTANLRAAGYSREERAAALGHAAADTSDQHYGKRNRGWRGLRQWIEIPEELIARVRPGAKTAAKLANDLPLTRSESITSRPRHSM